MVISTKDSMRRIRQIKRVPFVVRTLRSRLQTVHDDDDVAKDLKAQIRAEWKRAYTNRKIIETFIEIYSRQSIDVLSWIHLLYSTQGNDAQNY